MFGIQVNGQNWHVRGSTDQSLSMPNNLYCVVLHNNGLLRQDLKSMKKLPDLTY